MASEPDVDQSDLAKAARDIHREYGGPSIMLKMADEIERLRSLVRFHEEQKQQSEAMREAAMRMAYPNLFPELGGNSESGEP